eukprot:6411968-Alexandrium_andersonii.AAC.1
MDEIITGIGTGRMRFAPAHRLAQAIDHDGCAPPAVRAFGSLGAHGRCPSNVERDCHRWLRRCMVQRRLLLAQHIMLRHVWFAHSLPLNCRTCEIASGSRSLNCASPQH